MRTLHIVAQGATVRVAGERIEVWREGERLTSAGAATLEALVVHGAVQLTTAAVNRLLGAGVPCVFLTLDGRLKGRLEPVGHPAARLRAAQARAAVEPSARLRLARLIARNKLHAQARVLRAVRHPENEELTRLRARLVTAASLDEVRGLEGWASRRYFAAWRELLGLGSWRRRHRPPGDPLNALLSYAYALLLRPAWEAAAVVGLDPYQGFLHEPTRGQPALLLDLVEEFRAPLADLIVMDLFRRLRDRDGWWEAGDAGGVRLTLETRKVVIGRMEERLARKTRVPTAGHSGGGAKALFVAGEGPRAGDSVQRAAAARVVSAMEERWYSIVYDIPDDRRRERVAGWLEGWGHRVQRSVFEVELKPQEFRRMREGLLKLLDPAHDLVRIYHLGERGYRSIEAVTGAPARPAPRFIIAG